MNCPHCGDPLVDGRCVNALCDHATCPHGFKVWLFGTAEGCTACDAIEIVAGTRIGFFPRAAKPSNCPHDRRFEAGQGERGPCLQCAEEQHAKQTNCPHPRFECPLCRAPTWGLRHRCDDPIDCPECTTAAKPTNCPHCGEPMRETFTQFECLRCDRALVKGRCPHCGEPPPLHRVSCEVLDRLRAAAADAREGVEANVLSCPHGVPLAAAGRPCLVCIAATLERGKQARELVHRLATCAHPKALTVDGALHEWCPTCGAFAKWVPAGARASGVGPPGPSWTTPSLASRAESLDANGALMGMPSEAASADSEKKSDT